MKDPADMQTLLAIMCRLRDPQTGCPWDLEQDFSTIAPYTIEEAYEVADAIERGNPEDLKDELGDLLFQVVFHARMAQEQAWFEFADVVENICEKMLRRHPHVFGDDEVADAKAQTQAWEAHKAQEREALTDRSALAGVGRGLPEWLRALKLQKRAARVGFDWPDAVPVLDKLGEELDELREAMAEGDAAGIEGELGDLLFAAVNLARHLDVDVGRALRASNHKFESRFRAMEQLAQSRGQVFADLSLADQDALWNEVKGRE